MTSPKTCLLLLLTLIFSGCEKAKTEITFTEEPLLEEHKLYFDKSSKMEELLKGKSISSLMRLSQNTVPKQADAPLLVLFYTTYDCSSCVHKGFDFLKNKNLSESVHILPIEGGEKANFDTHHYEYEGEIWRDSTNAILDELGYFPTPVLINYSVDNGIENVYFIPTFEDSVMIGKFESLLTSK